MTNETTPTKEEFEQRYGVTISDEAFNFLRTFHWEICCNKNTKQFWRDLDRKNVNINELVKYCEERVKEQD